MKTERIKMAVNLKKCFVFVSLSLLLAGCNYQITIHDAPVSVSSDEAIEREHEQITKDFIGMLDEDQRPISDADIISPADSTPQGIWDIDENSQLDMGVQLKSVRFHNVEQIIGEDSEYEDQFANGTLTHTFLDVNDYHRYHFPVSGKILEVRKISALDAVGGLIAILPIAMSQVSSCNWEDTVTVGASVEKGDPMGYFQFGGSDIVMIFQEGVQLDLVTKEHIHMGEPYADVK